MSSWWNIDSPWPNRALEWKNKARTTRLGTRAIHVRTCTAHNSDFRNNTHLVTLPRNNNNQHYQTIFLTLVHFSNDRRYTPNKKIFQNYSCSTRIVNCSLVKREKKIQSYELLKKHVIQRVTSMSPRHCPWNNRRVSIQSKKLGKIAFRCLPRIIDHSSLTLQS